MAWLARQMAKKPIAGLLRIAWDSVGKIVARVVADHLDERRLEGLVASAWRILLSPRRTSTRG